MVNQKDTSNPKPLGHFADANESGKIMYIQQPKDVYSACFGGLMASRSQILGAAGVVIDGSFRDISDIQQLGLPVSIAVVETTSVLAHKLVSYLHWEPPSLAPMASREHRSLTSHCNLRMIFGFIQEIYWLETMMELWLFLLLSRKRLLHCARRESRLMRT